MNCVYIGRGGDGGSDVNCAHIGWGPEKISTSVWLASFPLEVDMASELAGSSTINTLRTCWDQPFTIIISYHTCTYTGVSLVT